MRNKGKRKPGLRAALLFLLTLMLLAGCSDGSGGNDAASDSAGGGSESETADRGTTNRGDRAAPEESAEPSAGDGPAEGGERGGGKRRVGEQPQAAPGQLTAGEWRDTDNWRQWQSLLNSREGDSYQRQWSFYRFDRLVVTATAAGKPLADAAVTVRDAQGQTVWEARTDASGKAYLFAGLFGGRQTDGQRNGQYENMPADDTASTGRSEPVPGRERGNGGYSVEIRSGSDVRRFKNVPIPRSEPLRAVFDGPARLPAAVDLMFVVDTTGSMQDEIDFLREELKDVIDRARNGVNERLSIGVSTNFYRDRYDEYLVKPYPFTENVDQAIKQIAAEQAAGGGDYPEAVDEALDDGLNGHDWSEEARARLLFLVLDAPPHDQPEIVERLQRLISDAAAKGVRVIPVASSGVDVQTEYLMRFLASATGGTYVFLTDDSGIGNDHLEPAVGEYEVKPLNDLLVEVIRRYTEPGSGSG